MKKHSIDILCFVLSLNVYRIKPDFCRMNILIVEDETEISLAISEFISTQITFCDTATDLQEARSKIYQGSWDCILLDIGLPSGSGLELVNEIKSIHPGCIIIILSAKNSDLDKIKGLDFGADDYMTKPFSLAELQSRINAIYRRLNPTKSTTLYYEGLLLDEFNYEVRYLQNRIEITRIEFYVLRLFLSNIGKVISKSSIIESIWQEDSETISNEDILYNHIKNIRKKLVEVGARNFIQTIYGLGYKLI